MKKQLITLSVIFFLLVKFSYSQLSGIYYISADSSKFPTFKAAVDSLELYGVDGPVIFNVMPGTYNERVYIDTIKGVSHSRTVTFQSFDGDSTSVILTSTPTGDGDDYALQFFSADYITFNGITIATGGTTYSRLIIFEYKATNISFTNCRLIGHSQEIFYISSDKNDSLLIMNNRIVNGSTAIFDNTSLNYNRKGLYVINNSFINQKNQVTYLYSREGFIFVANDIASDSATSTFSAIKAYDITGRYLIGSNRIFAKNYAIYLWHAYSSNSADTSLIANNSIYLSPSAGIENNAIYLYNSSNAKICFNSVNTNNDAVAGADILKLSASTAFVYNNNFIGQKTGYAINKSSNSTLLSDYNNLYMPGSYFARYNYTNCNSLTSWRTASGQDAHSTNVFTPFNSDTDLCAIAKTLNASAKPLVDVASDIEGKTRDASHPDIGAYEFKAYTINKSLSAGNGNFTSFNQAIDTLITNGVSESVTFFVAPDIYEEQVRILTIPGASEENTITFQSDNDDSTSVILQYSSSHLDTNYTLKFDGADHITFKGMTIKALDETYGRVIEYKNNACYNQLKNNIIQGINGAIETNQYALVYSTNSNDSNNAFINNKFVYGSIGLCFNGIDYLSPESGTYVDGNTFLNQYAKGIEFYGQGMFYVGKNKMSTHSAYEYYTNIHVQLCADGFTIEKNQLSTYHGDWTQGINIETTEGEKNNWGFVSNNFIESYGGGITLFNSRLVNVFFNSININGNNSNTSAIELFAGIGFTMDSVAVKNNILYSLNSFAFSSSASGSAFYSDNNDLFSKNGNVGYYNGTGYHTLAQWQTISGEDANSVSVDPKFISDTLLYTSVVAFNAAAIPVDGINDDIDGNARDVSHPDIGAYEFSPLTFNVFEITGDSVICEGDNAQMIAELTEGTGRQYAYSWTSNPAGFTSSLTFIEASPIVDTYYVLTASDGSTSIKDSLHITVNPSPVKPSKPVGDTSICMGSLNTVFTTTPSINTDYYKWFLDPSYAGVIDSTIAEKDTAISIDWDEFFIGEAQIKVYGVNTCGEGSYSDTLTAFVDDCTAIKELADEFEIKISPNPSNGNFTIYANGLVGRAILTIYSREGVVVYSDIINNNEIHKDIDVSALSKGIYFVKIASQEGNRFQKIVVQ